METEEKTEEKRKELLKLIKLSNKLQYKMEKEMLKVAPKEGLDDLIKKSREEIQSKNKVLNVIKDVKNFISCLEIENEKAS